MSPKAIDLQILGTGEFVPARKVESHVIDGRLSRPPGWTAHRTGVVSRGVAGPGEDVLAMGVAAARQAIDAAGIDPHTLDAVIAVGSVPAQAIPCTAVFFQRE